MALFTPGNLILNAGQEVMINPTNNLTGYIEMVANEVDDSSPIHQLVSVKKSLSNEYYEQNGFQMTKLALNDELVLFLRPVSNTTRLILLINTKSVTISDVNVSHLVGEQFVIEEMILSHTSKITHDLVDSDSYNNATLAIGPSDSVLLIATLIQN